MCFAFNLSELGCTDQIKMDIIDNDEPVFSKPCRATIINCSKIDQIVQKWKEAGLVTKTNSPYGSLVLLVQKKDADAQLVVDYWKLNAQTVWKVFSSQTLDEHLEVLFGSKLFTTLDLALGYYKYH